jgi:hypothetical protein
MNNNNKLFISMLFITLFFVQILQAQVASGGQYTLDEATIANGGGKLNGGVYSLEATYGLYNAGEIISGGNYTQQGGFNNAPQLAPTAAEVLVKGRVLGVNSSGLKNVIVTLIGGMMTAPMTARTNQFGHFQFRNIEVGHFYKIQVQHRKYYFENDSILFMLFEKNEEFIFREAEIKR